MKKAKKTKRFISLILAPAVLISCLFCLPSYERTASATENTRYINVVYDDSGSMVKTDGTASSATFYDKWCQAKYAMEVFSTMLSSNDTMSIFALSDGGEESLVISGSDSAQKRADQIHSWNTPGSSSTDFSVAEAAYEDLVSKGDDTSEKWLFIITDGAFEDKDSAYIEKQFAAYTAAGINVIYLAIGSDADTYSSDTANGLYCYKAAESSDILSCMTDISNLISERLELDQELYTTVSDGQLILSLDVSMEEIIIFAQGDDIEVGSMSADSGEAVSAESVDVEYSDEVYTGYQKYSDYIVIADDLSGSVTTFTGKNGEALEAGTYRVEVSDTTNLKIYYKPAVDVSLVITQSGEEIDPENDFIEPGQVTVSAVLTDAVTGETVESELVKVTSLSGELSNEGETMTISESSDSATFDVSAGTLSGTVSITYTGDSTEEISFSVTVAEPLSPITIDEIELTNLGNDGIFEKEDLMEEPAYAVITLKQDSAALSEEFWEAVTINFIADEDTCLTLETLSNEEAEAVLGHEVEISTFVVKVSYSRSADKTPYSDEIASFSVKAKLEYEGQAATSEDARMTVTAKKLSFLYFLKHNWLKLLIALIILLIIIGYLPGVKKRFPKSVRKRLVWTEADSIGNTTQKTAKLSVSTATVILPYVAQKGYLKTPANSGMSKLRLKAASHRRMEVTNAKNYAGKNNIRFDGNVIEKGTRRFFVYAGSSIQSSNSGKQYSITLAAGR